MGGKFSLLLRVTLAFILAGLSYNFSQGLIYIAIMACQPVVPPTEDLSTGPLAVYGRVCSALTGLGGPLIAFGILFLLLPKCSSSALARIIAIFTCLSTIAALAFNYSPVLSGGRTPGILLIAEIAGTMVGASLAFFCIRFKAIQPS
jgi:hypothetical protein